MTPRRLIWSEGLFVTQHHLQQLDRFHEALLDQRVRALTPYSWGLHAVDLDQRALEAGQVRVKRLSGVLPDGTPFTCSEQAGDVPPARTLEGAFTPQMQSLPVFVALPHTPRGAPSLAAEGGAASLARFVRQQSKVADENTGEGEHELAWARPNLRLLLGAESHEAYDTLQIADLIRSSAGQIVLRDTFVPPVFRVGASSFLMARLRAVLTAMTSRQRTLAASRRQRTAAAVDFDASDAAKFWLLDAINQSIPEISHIVDQGLATPEQTYLALVRLIGRLCTFAVDGDPTALPKFNYLDLGDTFERLFARVVALLNVVVSERFLQIPLQRREDGMYLGQIQDPDALAYNFFLAASGSMPEPEIRDALPRLSKIASWQQVGALLNSAINGARLELEYRPPGALPLRPGLVLFRVHKTPEFWKDIQTTRTIAIYHPPAPGKLELALYAVDPKNL